MTKYVEKIYNDTENQYKLLPELILKECITAEIFVNTHNNVKDFIISFFKDYNNLFYTYQNDLLYCWSGKKRSIGDLYRICLVLFPDVKLLEVLEILYNECENKENNLCTLICPTIYKRVYFISTIFSNIQSDDLTENYVDSKSNFAKPFYYSGTKSWQDKVGYAVDEFDLKIIDYVELFENIKKETYETV